MATYAVVDTENGLKIVEIQAGESAAAAAMRNGGVVADPNVYRRLQDAYDALLHMAREEEEDESP